MGAATRLAVLTVCVAGAAGCAVGASDTRSAAVPRDQPSITQTADSGMTRIELGRLGMDAARQR